MTIPINLDKENIRKFSKDIPGINMIFADMEKAESWIIKKGKDEGFAVELRKKLFDLSEEQVLLITTRTEPLLWILFFLPTSTSFYLLNSLSEIVGNISDILLETAVDIMNDKNKADKRSAQVFIDRCSHLNSASFINNITSEQFSTALLKAIEHVKKRSGDVY